ncbi:MAG: hypothetical protein G01um101418_890 [Parcubacteria group bacterium Gr01-1014_18]|nr:MAG: hypothetical protein Greene041636_929 [Parcubacteria group bacterium Greene0416_36]TSC79786.1 MAG: hypothetical protein G01um101418_890 [Parcubacteria group bacterium Gr01-1014_18]TSC98070.1 MAG: hypothetical protein Greene101420_899 [Parcubacteria group bacterium Greene1014_20]TSD06505.1 MAG: hypothetical protein Greene07142_848 [Parcubacteria group bacterium Greene0714_2]
MSPLQTQIDNDWKTALKAKSTDHPALSLLRAAIKQVIIDTGKELADADIVTIIQKEVKKRQDSISEYTKGNRPELAAKEQLEIDVYKKYLPSQMSEAEIKALTEKIIAEKNPANAGLLMKELMPLVKGKADGMTVKKVVEEMMKK